METTLFLQYLLYILGSIFLIVLIVLGIKLIYIVDTTKKIIDNVDKKVNSLNGLFNIIDNTTDKLSILSERIVEVVTTAVRKIFTKKRKEEKEDE